MKKIISFLLVIIMMFSITAVVGYSEDDKTEVPSSASVGENDIFVAVDGDDSAAGTIDAPLATFSAAKEKAKTVAGEEPINVWFRGGEYKITETLYFDETDRKNVTYRAYADENVELFAGEYITDWIETEVNGVTAWVADYSGDVFYALYNKDGFLTPSRYPETDYFYAVDGPSEIGLGPGEIWTAQGRPEDLLDFYSIEGVLCHIIARGWTEDILNIKEVNTETGDITFDRGCMFGLENEERYWFTNVREALDKPGEYYVDKAEKKVYYVPFEGETTENTILFRGNLTVMISGNGASDISFVGLSFSGTDYEILFGGACPVQIPTDVIVFAHSSGITVDGCVIHNAGLCGLGFHNSCSDIKITNNHVYQIGMSGICCSDCNWNSTLDFSENVTITNNLVEHFGRYQMYGHGIGLRDIKNCLVQFNTVHDGHYNGISFDDESQGYFGDYNFGSSVKILNNYVYDIGQNTLSDLGGIYTYGYHESMEIKNNVIHDVTGFTGLGGYGGCCIYVDTPSSHTTLENNLCFNCTAHPITMAFHEHNNVIRNNICAFGGLNAIQTGAVNYELCTPKENLLITGNILCVNDTIPFIDDWGKMKGWPAQFIEYSNLFYDFSGQYFDDGFYNDMYYDENPRFKDALHGDFTILENSPLYDIEEFTVWDIYDVGCHNEFRNTDVLAQINDPLFR